MATFPNLRPTERQYSAGRIPATIVAGLSGETRFRHGTAAHNHPLELTFPNKTMAEARLLRNHYRYQKARNRAFPLSALAWAGHTSFVDLVPPTTPWKYASPPREAQKSGGLIDVTVSLVSVLV